MRPVADAASPAEQAQLLRQFQASHDRVRVRLSPDDRMILDQMCQRVAKALHRPAKLPQDAAAMLRRAMPDLPRLMPTSASGETFGGVTYHIDGELVPVLSVDVTGMPVYFEHHILLWKNSTVGIGGLFDPASSVGLAKNSNDFGRTLGTWGVHPGPYLVLPFMGPSDLRDAIGKVPDGYMQPQAYINNLWIYLGVSAVYVIDLDARTITCASD